MDSRLIFLHSVMRLIQRISKVQVQPTIFEGSRKGEADLLPKCTKWNQEKPSGDKCDPY
jgi:hypothetical protein